MVTFDRYLWHIVMLLLCDVIALTAETAHTVHVLTKSSLQLYLMNSALSKWTFIPFVSGAEEHKLAQ